MQPSSPGPRNTSCGRDAGSGEPTERAAARARPESIDGKEPREAVAFPRFVLPFVPQAETRYIVRLLAGRRMRRLSAEGYAGLAQG
jgi:hypothetical protein